MTLQDEGKGTVSFWVQHADRSWSINHERYDLPSFEHEGVSVRVTKHTDKTVEINISGPLGQNFSFRHPLPLCGEGGLQLMIRWKRPELRLYLNGQIVDTVP